MTLRHNSSAPLLNRDKSSVSGDKGLEAFADGAATKIQRHARGHSSRLCHANDAVRVVPGGQQELRDLRRLAAARLSREHQRRRAGDCTEQVATDTLDASRTAHEAFLNEDNYGVTRLDAIKFQEREVAMQGEFFDYLCLWFVMIKIM